MSILEMKVDALVQFIIADDEEARRAAMAKLAKLSGSGAQIGNQQKGRDYYGEVTHVLNKLGVSTGILGYGYLRDAIIMHISDPEKIRQMTKVFYPAVGAMHNTTGNRAERGIRHAIETCWDRGDLELLESYFGNTVSPNKDKPTNREFISLVAEKVRLFGTAMN